MKRITIFTPTFNRAHYLPRLYESLIRQANKDFVWLLIDDGSTDGTRELVVNLINEKRITIKYVYQENAGMIGAHNTAHSLTETELSFCVDSDDFLVDDAIEKIIYLWNKYGHPNSAGLVGLNVQTEGKIVGTKFPEYFLEEKYSVLRKKCKAFADKAIVNNMRIFKEYLPYPQFDNERFRTTNYLYFLIEQKHKLLAFNEVFRVVEYMPDGLSNNLFEQYRTSPKSFAFYRITKMKCALTYKDRFRDAIHYVSSSLLAKNKDFLKESPYKITTVLATPLGFLFYLYLIRAKRKGVIRLKTFRSI